MESSASINAGSVQWLCLGGGTQIEKSLKCTLVGVP